MQIIKLLISIFKREYLLTFSFRRGEADEDVPYSAVFNEYCRTHHLVNIKSLGEDEFLEMSFYIFLKNPDQAAQFLLALEAIDRVDAPSLVLRPAPNAPDGLRRLCVRDEVLVDVSHHVKHLLQHEEPLATENLARALLELVVQAVSSGSRAAAISLRMLNTKQVALTHPY